MFYRQTARAHETTDNVNYCVADFPAHFPLTLSSEHHWQKQQNQHKSRTPPTALFAFSPTYGLERSSGSHKNRIGTQTNLLQNQTTTANKI